MLLAEANVPSLDVTKNDNSQSPFPVSTEINAHDLHATGNFESYITGEEKFLLYYLCMSSSNLNQTLLLNVQRPTSTTELSPPSSSSFLDLRTRSAKL